MWSVSFHAGLLAMEGEAGVDFDDVRELEAASVCVGLRMQLGHPVSRQVWGKFQRGRRSYRDEYELNCELGKLRL